MSLSARLRRASAAAATSGGFVIPDSDLVGHWDASDAATLADTGGLVDSWADKSSNGYDLTGSGGSRPTTGLDSQNSLNILYFAADYLSFASTAVLTELFDDSLGAIYVSMLVKCGFVADPNAVYGLIGSNKGSTSNQGFGIFHDTRNGTRDDSLNHSVKVTGSSIANGGTTSANDNSLAPNTWAHIHVRTRVDIGAEASSQRSHIYIDTGAGEVLWDNNTSGTNTPLIGNHAFTPNIGALGDGVIPFTGHIAEVMVWTPWTTESTCRANIDSYLSDKWAAI